MLAEVTLIGNLGRDPEIKTTGNGDRYARFSIAVNKVSKGEKTTMWVDVVVFDQKKVEVLEMYARKGTTLFIKGDLATRTYTNKDGIEKLAVEVVVGKFDGKLLLMGGRDAGAATQQQSAGSTTKPVSNPFDDLDDDVPGFS